VKFIAKAPINAATFGLAGDFAIDVLPDVARDLWAWWAKDQSEPERRADLEALAQVPADQMRREAEAAVAEVAVGKPPEIQQALIDYLTQLPGSVRQSLRRPADPSGTTLPPDFVLEGPDNLVPFLPARLPRFKPGDRPLAGVDRELLELLGVGGFGEVWKARNPHRAWTRPVALKFCLDTAAKYRLLGHEAAVLDQVMRDGHLPGIVPLQETYLSANPPCLEYDYIEGGDLTGLLREKNALGTGLPVDEATSIMLDLAEIIGRAHRLSPPVAHRDLKPANILIQRASDNKRAFFVTDFGIGGLAAGQEIHQTRQGTTEGHRLATVAKGAYTPLYASPQQMKGLPPDVRDDVHALGVIWFQLLTGDLGTGRPAGRGWRRCLETQGMAPPLVDVLESCFEDDPSDRPGDAQALAEELSKWVKAKGDADITHFSCPQCMAALRSAGPMAPGQKVRCPNCKNVFVPARASTAPTVQPTPKKEPEPARPALMPDREHRGPGVSAPSRPAARDRLADGPKGWDEASFFETLRQRDTKVVEIAKQIYEWGKNSGFRIGWSKAQNGSCQFFLDHNSLEYMPFTMRGGANPLIEVQLRRLGGAPPFQNQAKGEELLRRLREIPGMSIGEAACWPSIHLSRLAQTPVLERFLGVMKWVLAEIKAT
jgi:serine/threonine protein kinase